MVQFLLPPISDKQVSYMTNDYIINVIYKLEFSYIPNKLFHLQYQVLPRTWKWRHLV